MISNAPHCDVCGRRNVVAYSVEPEEAWRTVVLNRWRNLCPSCFEAERARALQLQGYRGSILVGPTAASEPLQAKAIDTMSRGYDEEAMKPMPRLGSPRPWWHQWMILAMFAVSMAIAPLAVWLFR